MIGYHTDVMMIMSDQILHYCGISNKLRPDKYSLGANIALGQLT